MTPSEEPYQRPYDLAGMRPHSRAESEPNPLPVPWRPKIATRNQLMRSPDSSPPKSPPPLNSSTDEHLRPRQQLTSPPPQPTAAVQGGHSKSSSSGGSGHKKKLNPLTSRPRSVSSQHARYMSASIDTNLHLRTRGGQSTAQQQQQHGGRLSYGARSWKQRAQVGPYNDGNALRKMSVDDSGATPLGWPSTPYFSSQNMAQGDRKVPADIKQLMSKNIPISPYSSVQDIPHALHSHYQAEPSHYLPGSGSTTSVEIRQELFSLHSAAHGGGGGGGDSPESHTPNGISPQASGKNFVTSSDNLKVNPITGAELSQKSHHDIYHSHKRSVSAKPTSHHGDRAHQAFSASSNHIGYEQQNGTPIVYTNDDERRHEDGGGSKRASTGLMARFKKAPRKRSATSPTVI